MLRNTRAALAAGCLAACAAGGYLSNHLERPASAEQVVVADPIRAN